MCRGTSIWPCQWVGRHAIQTHGHNRDNKTLTNCPDPLDLPQIRKHTNSKLYRQRRQLQHRISTCHLPRKTPDNRDTDARQQQVQPGKDHNSLSKTDNKPHHRQYNTQHRKTGQHNRYIHRRRLFRKSWCKTIHETDKHDIFKPDTNRQLYHESLRQRHRGKHRHSNKNIQRPPLSRPHNQQH